MLFELAVLAIVELVFETVLDWFKLVFSGGTQPAKSTENENKIGNARALREDKNEKYIRRISLVLF